MSSIEIDEKVLNDIFISVRILESNNLKTGEFTDTEMVKQIVRIIGREMQKGGVQADEV